MKSEEKMEMIRTAGPVEAEMIREILQNNGIESSLQGELAAATLPATGDLDEVRIWVKAKDASVARDLVDAYFTPVGKDELQEGERTLGVEDPTKPGGFTR
jgi:hypothetical protein